MLDGRNEAWSENHTHTDQIRSDKRTMFLEPDNVPLNLTFAETAG
jgi:hypothetical protein